MSTQTQPRMKNELWRALAFYAVLAAGFSLLLFRLFRLFNRQLQWNKLRLIF